MMAKAMADAGATRKSNVITEKGFNWQSQKSFL
jgi:hypothetical protein